MEDTLRRPAESHSDGVRAYIYAPKSTRISPVKEIGKRKREMKKLARLHPRFAELL
jgi:hypothetical protein